MASAGPPVPPGPALPFHVGAFIRSSLVWLAVGILLGASMAFHPETTLGYRPAHAHANLLGFVSMMIYGVAYHVLPRFTGRPLHSRGMAVLHVWIANVGLAMLVVAWIVRLEWMAPGAILLRLGAAASAVGAGLFVYNVWRTLGPLRFRGPDFDLGVWPGE